MTNKTAFFIVVVVLLVFSLYVLFVLLNPIDNTIPDGKGFIPVKITFENDIRNITLPVGSITNITTTLTSNLNFKATITLNLTFMYLEEWNFFNGELTNDVVTLEPFGTNSTILTLSVAEDTPTNIQPEILKLEMLCSKYPSVGLWDGVLEICVESP